MGKIVRVLFLLFLPALSSYGQILQWQQTKSDLPPFSGYLSTYENSLYCASESGLFYSPDSGDSWERVNGVLGSANIAMIYRHEKTLYVEIVALGPTDTYVLYELKDGGSQWDSVTTLGAGQYYSWSHNAIMLQGSALENFVQVSSDNGITWICASCPYEPEEPQAALLGDSILVMLTRKPGSMHFVYSTDLANSWTNINIFDSSIYPVAVRGNTIFAMVGADLYRSMDRGANWQMILGSVGYKIFQEDTIYALAGSNSMVISTDRGSSWATITNDGIPSLDFGEWVVGDGKMYAKFASGALYRTILPILSGVHAGKSSVYSNALTVYPNPAKDEVQIELEAAEQGVVRMELYDELGGCVIRREQAVTKGKQTISISTRELSEGIYNVRIGGVSGRFVKVK
jgi:photosystem II stability/assembly factor-like uncharacterized protein